MASKTYFYKVVSVAEEFLGPAAERFVRRQVEFHLSKNPKDLTSKDVLKLSRTFGTSLGQIVKSDEMIKRAVKKIEMIASE